MRTTPLVGRKVWFGPRRFGWGLGPVSPEGWAVVAVGVAAIIATAASHQRWIAAVIVLGMLVIVLAKGTSPGGPRQREEYQASKDRPAGQ